jgi:hypothetical protein
LHGLLNAEELPLIPKAYYDIYADPRLSEVARLMNCTKIALNPIHLDLDWFGLENWWRGEGVHGPDWQRAVTAGLVNLLESSFGLGHSNEHYDNWTWPSMSYGSPWESLELESPPSATPAAITVIWELNKDVDKATCDEPVDLGGGLGWLLKLTTPVPKKNRDTILQ